MNECCRNCAYCDETDQDYVCTCEDSEAYGISVSEDDSCGEFEENED